MIPLFDWFVIVPSSGSSVHGWGEVLLLTASTGLVGMGLSDIASGLSGRISGDEDAGQETSGDGGVAGGNGRDDGFGGDIGDDDFGGFDDWDDQGGELDDWSDGGGTDDFGGAGGGQSDLEPRIEELENEVSNIASTMGTVRSENEAINGTVEDIEDNIRKLLDIYEMVTRGVNPFVDDAQEGGGMGGSFGLFEDADDDGGLDDLDPDVADADPGSFFDDDFDDGEFDDDFDDGEFDDDFDDDFDDAEFDDGDFALGDVDGDDLPGGEEASASSGAGSDGEGKTFDELKSEYESGAVDWDERDDTHEDVPDGEGSAETEPAEPEEPGAGTDAADSTPTDGYEAPADAATVGDADVTSGSVHPDPEAEPSAGDRPSASEEADGSDGRDSGRHDASRSRTSDSDGKPYLESLPSGYGAELLVIEWLSYLRGRSSTAEALRAIKYYQTIGWIGDPAANSLQQYLSGLAGEDVTPSSTGGTQLTIDHHTNSLHYIGKLGGKHVDVERLEWGGTGRDGDRGRIERRGQRGIQR